MSMASGRRTVRGPPRSPFDGHYLRNRSTLYIGVLDYIGIVQHKEHSPEVLSIPHGTPCILYYIILYYIILYYIILYYIIILTIVLQLPTVFSTVTCCTGL